jgi:kojibiose phosphorylase
MPRRGGGVTRRAIRSPGRAAWAWRWAGRPGASLALAKQTGIATSRDPEPEPAAVASLTARAAAASDWEDLLAAHSAVWEKAWAKADVRMEGAPEIQKGLRLAVYHLLRCAPAVPGMTQVCPKGFAGEAYYGRYFWDTEIYLLPFYIYTDPAAARGLLMYRYNTLDGARANARAYGCRGAKFAWQSGSDGTEQCSMWEYADNELHVTADVAYGVTHYWRATGDFEFLRDHGLELLLETARYWRDRVDVDAAGVPHLINVMGPDEYSPMTRDNAFTNAMVRLNCGQAVQMARLVEDRDPDAYAAVASAIGLQADELEAFEQVALALPIPYDAGRKLVLQSVDFEDYADIDIEALWADRTRPFAFCVTQEKIYRSKCLKQADVIALMTLLPAEFSDEEVSAAYRYYRSLTVHDSSLSPAVHSLAAARLGDAEEVARYLDLALHVDFDPDGGGAAEGVHIANCAALWQLFAAGLSAHPLALGAPGAAAPLRIDRVDAVEVAAFADRPASDPVRPGLIGGPAWRDAHAPRQAAGCRAALS